MINIAIYANFGVIDDHTLASTLFVGKKIPLFIMPDIGRFYPLDAFELNIISLFFDVNASYFYFFNAICALIVIGCLLKALSLSFALPIKSTIFFILILLLLTSPSFITAFLRLFVPEKLESVFFAIFILCYVLFVKHNKISYFILTLFSANLALYYKEVAFIMLFAFGFFHFIFTFRTSNIFQKSLDIALMLSTLLWVALYYVIVIANKTTSANYGDTPYNKLIVGAKNIFNYILSEPFLVAGVFGILFYRIYLVLVKKDSVRPFLDSTLLAAALYVLAYFALNIYAIHYPLPAYIFALFPLGFYFRAYFKNIFIKILFYCCLVIYVFNAFPLFLYQANHYKAVPNNFQKSIAFLDSYLKEKPNTNIYLENVNRASSGEVYVSFIENLEFLGHHHFDMRSDIGIDNALLANPSATSPYSVFKNNDILQKQSGDLVIITPYGNKSFEGNADYELLFEATSGFNLPALGIKSLLKFAFVKILQKDNALMFSSNVYLLPIHFYIYRVK